jgi:hypothetical protein
MLEWLLTPIDPQRGHELSLAIAWHGRLMVFAWAILLPVGALIARFGKVTPRQRWPEVIDNRAWWHSHLLLQYLGGVCVLGALACVALAPRTGVASGFHAWFGWSVVALCLSQFFGGWFRGSKGGPTDTQMRGDHYDMTRRRRVFEYLHKSIGWIAVALSIAAVLSGLNLTNAPRWMFLVLPVWWAVLVGVGVVLQRRGRAIDTYQAIWGPDARHPGNQRTPIGWGVRRLADPGPSRTTQS